MSRKPETVFRKVLRDKLNVIPDSWWESIQQKTIQGTPDILGCVAGIFVALELKAWDTEEPSPLQKLKLSRIAKAGGLGIVVHPGNAENVLDLLKGLAKKK